MLPVTISLGLINVNLVINSLVGALVPAPSRDDEALANYAPAAIDKAFRIYMLPQGMFSVAVATVIFPTLSRYAARRDFDDLRRTMANGMRMILLVLVPAAAAILVLSEPMIRLVYQRGEFSPEQTPLVADGALLVRVLAAVQRALPDPDPDLLQPAAPWVPTCDRRAQPGDHRGGCVRLLQAVRRRPGSSPATAIATAASVVAQVDRPAPAARAGSSSRRCSTRPSGSPSASAALAGVS